MPHAGPTQQFGQAVQNADIRRTAQALLCQYCGITNTSLYPGSIPVSLSRADERRLVAGRTRYVFSPKADSVRTFLLAFTYQDKPLVMFGNRTLSLYFVDLEAKPTFFRGTLLDGEFVADLSLFLVFDCAAFNGISCRDMDYISRLRVASIAVSYVKQAHMILGESADRNAQGAAAGNATRKVQRDSNASSRQTKGGSQPGNNDARSQPANRKALQLQIKPVYDLKMLHKVTSTVIPTLPYKVDGFVFTPVSKVYSPGPDNELLKWKPVERQTIDLKLQIMDVCAGTSNNHTTDTKTPYGDLSSDRSLSSAPLRGSSAPSGSNDGCSSSGDAVERRQLDRDQQPSAPDQLAQHAPESVATTRANSQLNNGLSPPACGASNGQSASGSDCGKHTTGAGHQSLGCREIQSDASPAGPVGAPEVANKMEHMLVESNTVVVENHKSNGTLSYDVMLHITLWTCVYLIRTQQYQDVLLSQFDMSARDLVSTLHVNVDLDALGGPDDLAQRLRQALSGAIVECTYADKQYKLLAIRHDKTNPNLMDTVKATIQNIEENITIDELYDLVRARA